MYVDSKDFYELMPILLKLKKYSIDHLELSQEGAVVKATGFSRVNFDPISAIRELIQINSNSIIFDTDLPSTRAPIPFSIQDAQRITNEFDETTTNKILYENAVNFYKY